MVLQITVDGTAVQSSIESNGQTFAQLRQSISQSVDVVKNKTWYFVCYGDQLTASEETECKVEEICEDGKIIIKTAASSSIAAKSTDQQAATVATQTNTSAPTVVTGNVSPTPPPSQPAVAPTIPSQPTSPSDQRDTASQDGRLQNLFTSLNASAPKNLKDSASPLTTASLKDMLPGLNEKDDGAMQALRRLVLIDNALLNNTLPLALAFENGEVSQKPHSVKIVSAFSGLAAKQRKVIDEFFLSEKYASFPNHGSDLIRAFQSRSLMNLHQSSALHLAFDGSGNASIDAISLEAQQSASASTSRENLSTAGNENFHVSMIREEALVEIFIPRALIEVPTDVQTSFDRILNTYERNNKDKSEVTDSEALNDARGKLVREMQKMGFLVPQNYIVGGRLSVTQIDSKSTTREASESTAHQQFVTAVEGKVPLLAGGKSKSSAAKEDSESSSVDKDVQNILINIKSDGGDPSLRTQPLKWRKSLDDYTRLAVIGCNQPIPIWEFFDPALRHRFQKHLPLRFLTDFFKRNFDAGFQQHQDFMALKASANELEKLSFKSWDLRPHEVSITFGLPESKLPGSMPLLKVVRSEDYALVGPLKRKQDIVADSEHVITYLSIKTSFDPPGQWRVISGGLLQRSMVIEMEANTLRGFSWTIEAHQMPEKSVTDSKTFLDDFICYKAMTLAPDDVS